MTTTVTEVSEASFQTSVIEGSREAPVVVDFWAEWCAPCRSLGPVLERLAAEAGGAWTLAKVNVDANQNLAAAFGVQGIPAVKAFKNGRLVAEFTGALPEAQVRAWLRQLGPTPGELATAEGATAEASGDLEAAAAAYRRALASEPSLDEARSALARVELALRVDPGREEELRAALRRDPDDAAAAAALADILAARCDHAGAFELLLDVVTRTSGESRERAREHLVGLLAALPTDDPQAMGARRRLSGAIF